LVTRWRGALARAGGLTVIALGAGTIVLVGRPVSTGHVSRDTLSMFAIFGGVILIVGGIRLMVGPERLNEFLKPQRNRRR
jgi:sulfite exporter TauE/SafE